MAIESLKGFRWRRLSDTYWELCPRKGAHVASVIYDDDTRRWGWHVTMPNEWFSQSSPQGIARSVETAKAVCEAIARGIVEPDEEFVVQRKAEIHQIPFKHGLTWRNRTQRRQFERRIAFEFPDEFIEAYGKWNGGNIEGHLVFDTPVCRQLGVSKFLSLLDVEPGDDKYRDSILTEMRTNEALAPYAAALTFEDMPYIPFGIVAGSIDEREKKNRFNVRSALVFNRYGKSVMLLSGYKARTLALADSWSAFLQGAMLVPEE